MTMNNHLQAKLKSVVLFSSLILFGHFVLIFSQAITAGEVFAETDVTRDFISGQGTISCRTGYANWDGQKLTIDNTSNGNCMVQVSTGELENFRIRANVRASGGNNYSAGIFFGGLDGAAARSGSIFFTRSNMFGLQLVDAFKSLPNNTETLLSLPDAGAPGASTLLELIKNGRQYRFYANNSLVREWHDAVSRKYPVWLVVSSFGAASQGVFEDFRVYSLGSSAMQDTRQDELQIIPPAREGDSEDGWSDL